MSVTRAAVTSDYERLAALAVELEDAERALVELYARWEQLDSV